MDYELAKEQAALALLIQESRREIEALKAEKDAFLKEREEDVLLRVVETLDRARGLIEETNGYAAILEAMRKEAENILSELQSSKVLLQEGRRDFKQRTEEIHTLLSSKAMEMEMLAASAREEKARLNGLLDSLRLERSALEKEQKKVDEDRGKLRAAFKVWQKQKETKIE